MIKMRVEFPGRGFIECTSEQTIDELTDGFAENFPKSSRLQNASGDTYLIPYELMSTGYLRLSEIEEESA